MLHRAKPDLQGILVQDMSGLSRLTGSHHGVHEDARSRSESLAWADGRPDASHPLQELERCDAVQGALAEAVSGVYSGWASIGSSPEAYMTAMSIGGCPCALEMQATISWLHHCTRQHTRRMLSAWLGTSQEALVIRERYCPLQAGIPTSRTSREQQNPGCFTNLMRISMVSPSRPCACLPPCPGSSIYSLRLAEDGRRVWQS